MSRFSVAAAGLLSTTLVASGALAAPVRLAPGDWASNGADSGQTKYSPLAQITPQNVAQLKTAWVYDTKVPVGGRVFRGWQVGPLVIGGVMYFYGPDTSVTAVDGDTGAVVWKTDVGALAKAAGKRTGATHWRTNLSLWPGDARNGPRLVVDMADGYLVQLDMANGKLFDRIGDKGFIDLAVGETERFGGVYTPGAPAAIYKNLAIVSPRTGEQGRYGLAGDVRAFDLTTGREVWTFHSVPQPGEPNFEKVSWGIDGWQDRRGPGSWVPITVDPERKLAFVAFGNATDQNYGGNRPGDNLYAASLVAIDVETGKYRWHFQTARHDIFDWDLTSPATFIDVKKDGKVIPALAVPTKQGELWILNRDTGEPVFGAEDRPVPMSDAPGEAASPTQPFPLKPEPVARVRMTRAEVPRISEAGYQQCLKLYDSGVQMGPHTPYLMVRSIVFPSSEGGVARGGAAYDPQNGLIVVNSKSIGQLGILQPTRSNNMFDSYAKQEIPFEDAEGFQCSPPPWGEIMAINANTGDTVWRVPLGEYKQLTERGIPKTGTPNAGGPAVTGGGLVFIGATADRMFRAFDVKTGKELWSIELPNNSAVEPVVYRGKSGKQYVAAIVTTGMNEFNIPRMQTYPTHQIHVFALP